MEQCVWGRAMVECKSDRAGGGESIEQEQVSKIDRWSEAGGDESTDGNGTAGPGALSRFVVSDGSDSRALAFLAGYRGSASSSSSLAFVSIGRRWRIGIGIGGS